MRVNGRTAKATVHGPPAFNWGTEDLLAAAILLSVFVAAVVIARRLIPSGRRRAIAIGAITLAVALVWAGLAVGLFD